MRCFAGFSATQPLEQFLQTYFGLDVANAAANALRCRRRSPGELPVAFFGCCSHDAPHPPFVSWPWRSPQSSIPAGMQHLQVAPPTFLCIFQVLPGPVRDYLEHHCLVVAQASPTGGHWAVCVPRRLPQLNPSSRPAPSRNNPDASLVNHDRLVRLGVKDRATPPLPSVSSQLLLGRAHTEMKWRATMATAMQATVAPQHTKDALTSAVNAFIESSRQVNAASIAQGVSAACSQEFLWSPKAVVLFLHRVLKDADRRHSLVGNAEALVHVASNVAELICATSTDGLSPIAGVAKGVSAPGSIIGVACLLGVRNRRERALVSHAVTTAIAVAALDVSLWACATALWPARFTRCLRRLVLVPKNQWSRRLRSAQIGFRNVSNLKTVRCKKDLARRAASSPHRHLLCHGHVRFLPDANKLRPVVTMRFASVSGMAKKIPRRGVSERERCPITVLGRAGVAVERPRRVGPNQSALRVALSCLQASRRRVDVSSTVAGISHRKARDELACIVSLADALRWANTSGRRPASVTFIKADGSRCYDRLNQQEIKRRVTCSMRDRQYTQLSGVLWRLDRAGHRTGSKPFTLVRNSDETECCHVPMLPMNTLFVASSCTALDAPYYRDVVLHAVKQPLIDMGQSGGGVHCQETGIAQGSCLSPLLADMALEEVDEAISVVLEGLHSEPCLLLRRMDDVLVAVCDDEDGGAQQALAKRVIGEIKALDGRLSCNFQCNESKLAHTTGPGTTVPWCGVLIGPDAEGGIAVLPDWSRLTFPPPRSRAGGAPDVLLAQYLRCLGLRLPKLLFHARVNSSTTREAVLESSAAACARAVLHALDGSEQQTHSVVQLLKLARVAGDWLGDHAFRQAAGGGDDVKPGLRFVVGRAIAADLQREFGVRIRCFHSPSRLRIAIAVLRSIG